MNQELYRQELRDLKTWQRKCRRLNRPDVMSDEEIVARATLLASPGGLEAHYADLREQGRRNTRPAFLTGVTGAPGEPTKPSDHEKLQKLFAKL
jgi:hypothetical protein